MTTTKYTKPVPQHTTGPWQYEPYDSGDPSVGMGASPAIVFKELEDGTVVDIALMQTPVYAIAGKSEYDDGELFDGTETGNARLISAAPDLLAVLECIQACWDNREPAGQYRDAMKKAIAKAKGIEG